MLSKPLLDRGLIGPDQLAGVLAVLFAYAFLSNVALALVPHEPVVAWYGSQAGVWTTALVATAGTVAASWVDHRLFVPLIARASRDRSVPGAAQRLMRLFRRAPFAVLAVSGITPLPFFPFKALAFAARYPLNRYLAAVAAGRMPRYLLLAWLGTTLPIPAWLLAALFVPLALPSLRLVFRRTPQAALRGLRRGTSKRTTSGAAGRGPGL